MEGDGNVYYVVNDDTNEGGTTIAISDIAGSSLPAISSGGSGNVAKLSVSDIDASVQRALAQQRAAEQARAQALNDLLSAEELLKSTTKQDMDVVANDKQQLANAQQLAQQWTSYLSNAQEKLKSDQQSLQQLLQDEQQLQRIIESSAPPALAASFLQVEEQITTPDSLMPSLDAILAAFEAVGAAPSQ